MTQLKTSDEVMNRMIEKISAEEWKSGDVLPGERNLCEAFGVSRALMRESLVALQLLGIVNVRHGGKRTIADFSYDKVSPLMAATLRHQPHFNDDLLHFREVLECDAVRLASSYRDCGNLLALVDQMTQAIDADETVRAELDLQFHQELFRLSRNVLLIKTADLIESLLVHSVRFNRATILQDPRYAEILIHQHARIALAIREGEADIGAEAMRNHLQTVKQFQEVL
jgi:GntR family transcriptional repressor for pyruvate dehydrogenase complex